ATGTGGFQPLPGTYSRTIFAGTPATTHRSGTTPRTTNPAATTTLPTMAAPGITMPPAPSQLPGRIETEVLLGHCRPMGTSGSVYPWFWSVRYTYGPVKKSSPI